MMTQKYIPAKSRNIHTWWDKKLDEKFWLEVTGRTDIGVNLKAPQANEHGNNLWSYSWHWCINREMGSIHLSKTESLMQLCSFRAFLIELCD